LASREKLTRSVRAKESRPKRRQNGINVKPENEKSTEAL